MGTSLGHNAFKIRLKVKSKGKGKSGGARVISYLDKAFLSTKSKKIIVNLITVYDKSEKENITDLELRKLIESL